MEFLQIEQMGMFVLLFFVALIAGFVDAVAGGGGLIALPALLYTGITPLQALATNKLQGSFGTLASTLNFVRHGHIDLKEMAPAVLLTFTGAATGTLFVQLFSTDFLQIFMPIALFGIVLFFVWQPQLGEEDRHRRIGHWGFALVFGFGLGFYDGFFGPGTGSFFHARLRSFAWIQSRQGDGQYQITQFYQQYHLPLLFHHRGACGLVAGTYDGVGTVGRGDAWARI